jgi:predicted esterase
MRTALLALHGFTMNGAGLRRLMSRLEPRLSESVELVFVNAPHAASEAAVAGLEKRMGVPRGAPPHLQWWNSSDDGRAYRGWDISLEALRATLERHPGAGVLGFSQGAAAAAAMVALSCRGLLPPLRFAVLVAGFTPRSAELAPLFSEHEAPLAVPSLHVWGEKDPFLKHGPALAERFSAQSRQLLTWPGGHNVPQNGEAGDTLVEFVRRHAHSPAAIGTDSIGAAPQAGRSDEPV